MKHLLDTEGAGLRSRCPFDPGILRFALLLAGGQTKRQNKNTGESFFHRRIVIFQQGPRLRPARCKGILRLRWEQRRLGKTARL